jgi:hypothetical protein
MIIDPVTATNLPDAKRKEYGIGGVQSLMKIKTKENCHQ